MLKRIIAFLKTRPTEVWLGLWAVIVAVLYGTEAPTWTTGVSAVFGWLVTFIASRDSNSLGPQPGE
jgi:hypothetical protein